MCSVKLAHGQTCFKPIFSDEKFLCEISAPSAARRFYGLEKPYRRAAENAEVNAESLNCASTPISVCLPAALSKVTMPCKMSRLRLLLVFTLLVCLVAGAWLWWSWPAKVDMAQYA